MNKIPYIGFGFDTLKKQPILKIGDLIHCPHCHLTHIVKGGKDEKGKETDKLLFFECNNKIFLAGVAGRLVIDIKLDCSGKT